MEYLMTYGWAIVVVIVMGVAMWRLGVFNMGGSIAPTAEGFQAIKPLLPMCRMGDWVWNPVFQCNGFTCQFTNNAGAEIRITDLNLGVDGKSCRWMIVDVDPLNSPTSDYLFKTCNDENFNCPTITCSGLQNRCVPSPPASYPYFIVPKDTQFTVMTNSYYLTGSPSAIGPCVTVSSEQRYEITIDLTYEITIGEATSTKHSRGKITIYGE